LRDLLNSIFYYRNTALLLAFLLTVLGVAIALLLPPSYVSRARLLTLNAGVYDMQPGTTTTPPVQDPTAAVNTEMQLLASSELHREVAREELGPSASTDTINRWVRQFESHLHITKVEAANVIELDLSARDPNEAAGSLKRLLEGYFRQRAEVLTSGRVAFLADQRDKVKEQLDDANAQIAAYEKQNGVVDVEAQINGAVEQDTQLHQQQQEADAAVAESRKSVAVLVTNAQGVPPTVEIYNDNTEAAHTIGTMQSSLLQLEAKRADLASRYMPESPFVTQADAQIAQLRGEIEKQKLDLMSSRRTGYNGYHDTVQDQVAQAQAKMAGATARRNTLNGQVAASRDHLKSLISVSDTLSRMKMQRDLLADTVKTYSTQLEQARIQQNQATSLGSTNVRVIEAPVPPSRRSNPPLLIIAAAIVSALAITAVVVFLLSSLRETFLSPQEAERGLDLPVLCILPRRSSSASARRDYGRLIAEINTHHTAETGKIVLMLTPHSQTELDATAEGLIAALERRAPGQVALLKLDPEAATSNCGVVMHQQDGIATGTIGIEIPRENLAGILSELRAAHDYVILTAPPASSYFESVETAPLADLVLLVLQAEETRKPVAEAIVEQVAHMGARVSGLIMTGRRYLIPGWVYRMVLDKRSAA
jgi:uncharacterized protein involved in exopolysaccharide biosynthesis